MGDRLTGFGFGTRGHVDLGTFTEDGEAYLVVYPRVAAGTAGVGMECGSISSRDVAGMMTMAKVEHLHDDDFTCEVGNVDIWVEFGCRCKRLIESVTEYPDCPGE